LLGRRVCHEHKMVSALRLLNRWRWRHLQVCPDCGIRMTSVRFRLTAIGSYAGRRLGSGRLSPVRILRLAMSDRCLSTTGSVPAFASGGGGGGLRGSIGGPHFRTEPAVTRWPTASCGRFVRPRRGRPSNSAERLTGLGGAKSSLMARSCGGATFSSITGRGCA
jgi:hypothetical protein